jgi:hypothetical protein
MPTSLFRTGLTLILTACAGLLPAADGPAGPGRAM